MKRMPSCTRRSSSAAYRPRRDAGDVELEDHRLRRDDPVHRRQRHRPDPVVQRLASTLTRSDIDAFVAANQASWHRLEELTRRARRVRSATPDELDELVATYQRVGAQLATARVTYADDAPMVSRLTLLVADAHGVLYGQRDTDVVGAVAPVRDGDLPRRGVPHPLVHARRRLLTFIPWAVFQTWLAVSPCVFDAERARRRSREAYIHQDFEAYYSSQPAQNFATQVFFNNVRRRLPGVRRRRAVLRGHRCAPGLQRCQRRHGRRPVHRGRRGRQVLGPDPPPRDARAERGDRRRCRRAAHRLDADRPRGPDALRRPDRGVAPAPCRSCSASSSRS